MLLLFFHNLTFSFVVGKYVPFYLYWVCHRELKQKSHSLTASTGPLTFKCSPLLHHILSTKWGYTCQYFYAVSDLTDVKECKTAHRNWTKSIQNL